MTAMRNGVYVLLAVAVGVMLVGLLPGEISNMAAPQVTRMSTSSTAKSTSNLTSAQGTVVNITGGGSSSNGTYKGATPLRANFTIRTASAANSTEASVSALAQTTAADAATAAATSAKMAVDSAASHSNPYSDLGYYALWGVGLVAALSVYLLSKRLLG